MQLVSSCMRHMQLEIRLVANDKLHEICSCIRQYVYDKYIWLGYTVSSTHILY
jgi:hypothetical protein